MMNTLYFTLTGTDHYYGTEFLEKGMQVYLVKEPDNDFDKEAIQVKVEGLGKIGYVANSPYTVLGETMSAGRIYDKIAEQCEATIVLITKIGVICKIVKE